MKGFGILYLAIGQYYFDLATTSIAFLRRTGYSGPIRLVTDCDGNIHSSVSKILVQSCSTGFDSRYYKTQLYNYRFEKTLYLDCDTIALKNPVLLLKFLLNHDLSMTRDLHRNVEHLVENSINEPKRRQDEYNLMSDLNLLNHNFYNSGVMFFVENESIKRLFEDWHREWLKFKHEDQLSLVRAMAKNTINFLELNCKWNVRPRAYKSIADAYKDNVVILHFLSRQRELWNEMINISGDGCYCC